MNLHMNQGNLFYDKRRDVWQSFDDLFALFFLSLVSTYATQHSPFPVYSLVVMT
jgi:hypothetical protein